MKEICSKEICTGCCMCGDICPVGAIMMKYDNEGFIFPEIDESKCINCKKCYINCPNNKEVPFKKDFEAYLSWNKDEMIRRKSSSGGIFYAIAEYVINKNGIVYGAKFDSVFQLRHVEARTSNELYKLLGSKYIQSDMSSIYHAIRSNLNEKMLVLFCGTPCQVSALYSFLDKKYDNLITVDFLCHGVGSKKYFEQCLLYLERENNTRIKTITFRKKHTNWKEYIFQAEYTNGRKYEKKFKESMYGKPFYEKVCVRKSCYLCKYSCERRISDVTLGDYGGDDYSNYEAKDIESGMSTLLLNSEKGKEIFKKIKEDLYYESRESAYIINSSACLKKSNYYNYLRKQFFHDLNKLNFDIFIDKYCSDKSYRISIIKKMFGKMEKRKLIKLKENNGGNKQCSKEKPY